MATSYFGNRNSGTGNSPYHQLVPLPLLNKTNFIRNSSAITSNYHYLPIYRSAATNNYFQFSGAFTSCTLYSVNAAGTSSTVGTSTFTTYLTSSDAVSVHLNTTDQCLYILLYESPNYRLIKMGDASGITTTIGSSFTPATANNWPVNIFQNAAQMFVDPVSGHLKIYYRGYTHLINKTTGAIVSQDVAASIGPYSLINTTYLTSDNTIAAGPVISKGGVSENGYDLSIGNLIHSSLGEKHGAQIQQNLISNLAFFVRYLVMVDSDKIYLGSLGTDDSDASAPPLGFVNRSDFDQLLQSSVDYYIG